MEPMTLGSPVNSPSSNAAGNNQNQSQYLPPFLMGDPQTMPSHNNTLSPKPGRYNVSFGPTSPTHSAPQDFNRSALGTRTLFGGASFSGSGAGTPNTVISPGFGPVPLTPQHTTSHQTGPPTQGLFDTLRNDNSSLTTQRTHLGVLQTPQSHLNTTPYNMSRANLNYSLNQSYNQAGNNHLDDSYLPNAPNAVNASMRALCSPLGANMSPLGTSPQPRNADFWVTIFGFPPGGTSMILQNFTQCGTIMDVVHAPQNGNWMHVRFSSRIESDRALNYNQKVIGGNFMIGVIRCTERSVIDKENSNVSSNTDVELTRPKVRPLAQQSFKIAQQDNAVSPNKNVPQKSTGLVNKAIDLFFGW
ncbi:nucleoporin Nup35 [Scaptodrosophila lebanonensis]|uniref:Nucleoporin NUP35 n=1 Tax=Drosophila lebanonensis TaxID=7225 RepID=A0A6J2TU12_DROLE|nr:nucleoporin Nup35 [Scaptodrosophila lebanonensis]